MSWRRFFRRAERDAEIARDIQFYVDTETEDNIARGMPPKEALVAARRKFGNPSLIREEIYRMNSAGLLETVWQDILYALRTMRKNPVFAVTAVLTLALGIGANTVIFSVIRAVLLKPLQYRDPDRLVRLPDGTQGRYEQMRLAIRSFTGIGVFTVGTENVTLSGSAVPEVIRGARVSANFLHILGVEPVLGRGFLPEEDTPGGPMAVMISTGLWKRRFGGDPLLAGMTATLDSMPYTIVGVLPAGFEFPFAGIDVWLTRPSEWSVVPPQSRPASPILTGFARLRPNADMEQAGAELTVLHHRYAAAHPGMLDSFPGATVRVQPLKDRRVANVRQILWMLFGAVGFVLLIACANVASLLLARAASRSREFAVRAALGAARSRLIGQLLAESLVLALAGGALGILLANWSLSAITGVNALDLPRAGEIRLDGTVLGFVVALSIVTGVLFGLFPSLHVSRPDLAHLLRESGAGVGRGSSGKRGALGVSARGLLVVGQVALSTVLLIGAALLMQSLTRLYRVDPGFRTGNLLTMKIALPAARYDTDRKKAAFFEELVRRVEAVPGVRSAAVTLTLPMTGFAGSPVQVAEGSPVRLNERPIAIIQHITPAYFRTLGIPLRRGREFTGRDIQGAEPVAIISEKLARGFWPAYPNGQDPVGEHILIGSNPQPARIVGIVADMRQASLALDHRPGVYRPFAQDPLQSAALAVRTESDPLRFISSVRSQVLAIDRDQPVSAIQTMDEIVESSEGRRRLILLLLGLFAGTALLLAVIGIYGVVAYSVAQRTQEVGIRRALGAQQGDILRLMLIQGLALTLAGVAIGIGGALALTRVMTSLLFQVSATDPATFAGIALLFVLVALAASYIPARRATRIDPMVALRVG